MKEQAQMHVIHFSKPVRARFQEFRQLVYESTSCCAVLP